MAFPIGSEIFFHSFVCFCPYSLQFVLPNDFSPESSAYTWLPLPLLSAAMPWCFPYYCVIIFDTVFCVHLVFLFNICFSQYSPVRQNQQRSVQTWKWVELLVGLASLITVGRNDSESCRLRQERRRKCVKVRFLFSPRSVCLGIHQV